MVLHGLHPNSTQDTEIYPQHPSASLPTVSHDPYPISPQRVELLPHHPLSLPVLALLIPGTLFGVLARLGLQALATYDGQSIFSLAYVQATGCLIMGFCLGLKEPIGRFYPPLYTALTTGFCGSLTTFSSWQLDVFESFVNVNNAHRGALRDVVDAMTKTVFTFSFSIGSIVFGMHLASAVSSRLPQVHPPGPRARVAMIVVSILLYAATFPAYFRLPSQFRHQATAALIFSFPGTLTRHVLSTQFNPTFKFPLGTFLANSIGTALLGAFHALSSSSPAVSGNACALLRGLQDGYCGCFTTVSTMSAEIRGFSLRKGSSYALASWMTAQLLLLVILGPLYWHNHVSMEPTCRYE